MSVADVNTEMAAAVAALKDGDHSTALLRATAAQGLLATIPDSEKAGESMRWREGSIGEFIKNIARLQTAAVAADGAGPMRRSRITFKRAGSSAAAW